MSFIQEAPYLFQRTSSAPARSVKSISVATVTNTGKVTIHSPGDVMIRITCSSDPYSYKPVWFTSDSYTAPSGSAAVLLNEMKAKANTLKTLRNLPSLTRYDETITNNFSTTSKDLSASDLQGICSSELSPKYSYLAPVASTANDYSVLKDKFINNIPVKGQSYVISSALTDSDVSNIKVIDNGEYFYEMSENLDLSECLTESGEFTSEPVVRYMDLSTVRETMNFGSSDAALNNARLCVDFDTNIGQASAADLTITPYYGGVPSESVTRRLEIQPSMSMEQMTKTKYWLGSNRDVASEDYIFVDFPIQDILKELPDMIKISMTAVNVKNGKSMGVTKAEIPADYRLEADCRFEVPLVFDETSQVTFSYTIENLQNVLTEVFTNGNLIFTGTVINSFPLNITMNGELLDSAGKTIAVNGANMVIPAGSVDHPVTTDIDFSFNKDDLGTDTDTYISGVRLNFTATGVNGAAITSESTLEVSLQAYVPNGLPINLKDLLNVQK